MQRTRKSPEQRAQEAREALERIQSSPSLSNFPTVVQGFLDKGIPEDQISPKENCLTYRAWQAKGRQVRRGQHGVKVTVWIPTKDKDTGEAGKMAVRSTVFHVSQTDPIERPWTAIRADLDRPATLSRPAPAEPFALFPTAIAPGIDRADADYFESQDYQRDLES